jgi:hypothetical protein
MTQENAANAPQKPDGQDPYVKGLTLKGNEYYLYIHRFLHYYAYANFLVYFTDACFLVFIVVCLLMCQEFFF